jgi:hypothetical protein
MTTVIAHFSLFSCILIFNIARVAFHVECHLIVCVWAEPSWSLLWLFSQRLKMKSVNEKLIYRTIDSFHPFKIVPFTTSRSIAFGHFWPCIVRLLLPRVNFPLNHVCVCVCRGSAKSNFPSGLEHIYGFSAKTVRGSFTARFFSFWFILLSSLPPRDVGYREAIENVSIAMFVDKNVYY